MPFADANGQRLYYEVHGDNEAEPLLAVHGLSAGTLGWIPQVPAWSQHHRTVIFDNRDVGQSSRATGSYEVADMAADTLALADELGLESFHLLGLSMGGAISQEIAISVPERVRTLTLCVSFGGGGAWGHLQGQVWAERVMNMTPEQRVDELMLLCFSEEAFENAEMVAYTREMLLANPHPQEAEAFVRQLLSTSRHETRDRLAGLSMPVHVIGAEQDTLLPVWKSTELADLIPGARLTLLPGGHAVNLERAEEFNTAVLEFLAEAGVRS
ncbi:MAG: alpha/beta fold hydrolase [Solirubrobacterales bacterium]